MGRYKARCENCKGAKTFSDTLCSYKLEDGTTVNIERTFAWCSGCTEVVWAESILSLEELRGEREGLDNPSDETIDYLTSLAGRYSTFEEELERSISFLDERIRWRESRESPPRCLSCGSTEITPGIEGETNSGNPKWEIPCPACGGTIRVLSEPSLSLDRGWIHFTPEGLQEGSYVMSPSKGATPTNLKP